MSAFDASDAIRLPSQALVNLPVEDWPNTVLRFHPSMQIFTSRWNVVEIWRAIREQKQPPGPVESKNSWLVWRNSARLTEFKSVSDLEAKLLKYSLEGQNLAELCEFLVTRVEENSVAVTLITIIKSWFAKGIVSAIHN